MFVDSHCHINFPELAERLPEILATMQANQVSDALCVSVTLPEFPQVLALAEAYPNIYAWLVYIRITMTRPNPAPNN